MESGQFIWRSQTEVLPERDEQLRGKSILNVKAEQFWELFWTFHSDRFLHQSSDESLCKPGCSQVDVRNVKFVSKWRSRWCEFLVWRTLRYDNCRRRKWSPRKCGKFVKSKFKILTCVVLLGRLISWGEYQHWNMMRGISFCVSPALPWCSQSRHQLFSLFRE